MRHPNYEKMRSEINVAGSVAKRMENGRRSYLLSFDECVMFRPYNSKDATRRGSRTVEMNPKSNSGCKMMLKPKRP